MSEKKPSAFERGMQAGAKPFEEKFNSMENNYQHLKSEINNVAEKNDQINGILNPEYGELVKKLANEKVSLTQAKNQFIHYVISESFSVFNALCGNHPDACYYLGEIYHYGYGNIRKDEKKSSDCYLLGYQSDDLLCGLKLAEHYPTLLPQGMLPTDILERSISELKYKIKKTDENTAIYEYELAEMYEMGWGCDIDEKRAFEHYSVAAEKKYFRAIYKIYKCYSEGIGTEPMPKKARSYYEECQAMGYLKK